MFTGIVEELGEVVAVVPAAQSSRLTLRGPVVMQGAVHGASIAVNGVCLTVTDDEVSGAEFTVDVMAETLRASNLGELAAGDRVNLERPMVLGGRLDGHLVQGHVDGVATILERTPGDRWEVVRLSLPGELARYVVAKGSITLDGTSLTVVEAGPDWFTISLIPTTLELTTLGRKGVGQTCNVEVDVIAKYVERLTQTRTTEEQS